MDTIINSVSDAMPSVLHSSSSSAAIIIVIIIAFMICRVKDLHGRQMSTLAVRARLRLRSVVESVSWSILAG